jgi:hypothetical protein
MMGTERSLPLVPAKAGTQYFAKLWVPLPRERTERVAKLELTNANVRPDDRTDAALELWGTTD